jgi:glycosyltransferase involved in cell wall biosynthesis
MRIAQISPLHERVPPVAYGGTERVVHWLTEELVRRGHAVTLFASGDSETSATLVPGSTRGLRLDGNVHDALPWHFAMIDDVCARAAEFDVLHFHTEYLHLAPAARTALPCVTTLHGRLDLPDAIPYFRRFADLAYVSISDSQREPLTDLNWAATVHHGLPPDLLTPSAAPGSFLAFLGRLSPEKGFEAACAIADRAGMPIRVAGKMDRADDVYIRERCKPLLARRGVEYLGEINGRPKNELLAGAHACSSPSTGPSRSAS